MPKKTFTELIEIKHKVKLVDDNFYDLDNCYRNVSSNILMPVIQLK